MITVLVTCSSEAPHPHPLQYDVGYACEPEIPATIYVG